MASEFFKQPTLIENRGRRECRVRAAPMVRVQAKKHAAEPQVQPEQPAFPARWCYGLYVISSVNRAFLPPSSADRSAHLAPASGRQDHTTSPSAIRHSSRDISRPSHPASTFVTIAKRPSA